jgi:Flp pilus assembly protein TadD
MLHQAGKSREALAQIREYVAGAPDDAEGHALMAAILLRVATPAEALAAADRAVALAPDLDWAHRMRAAALSELGKKRDALAAAREAVKLEPESVLNQYVVATMAADAKKYTEADLAASEAVRLGPDEPYGQLARGYVALSRKRWPEAEGHFRTALSIDPENASALNNLGLALEGQGKRGEAAARLADASRLAPEDPTAGNNLVRMATRLAPFAVLYGISTIGRLVRFSQGASIGLAIAVMAVLYGGLYVVRASRLKGLPADAQAYVRAQRRTAVRPWAIAFVGSLVFLAIASIGQFLPLGGATPENQSQRGIGYAVLAGLTAVAIVSAIQLKRRVPPGGWRHLFRHR